MSLEARYVGARSRGNWRTNNYNELNIIENRFLDEFSLAQQNLQSHVAAGCGSTPPVRVRLSRPDTGTSPLPNFFGVFPGCRRRHKSASYTSANFRATRSSRRSRATIRIRTRQWMRSTLTPTREACDRGRTPSNLILVNPDLLGGANIVENDTKTMFNSMVLELRRRVSSGLESRRATYSGMPLSRVPVAAHRQPDGPERRRGGADARIQGERRLRAAVRPGRRFGSSAGPG